jgi:hypothetical protein
MTTRAGIWAGGIAKHLKDEVLAAALFNILDKLAHETKATDPHGLASALNLGRLLALRLGGIGIFEGQIVAKAWRNQRNGRRA